MHCCCTVSFVFKLLVIEVETFLAIIRSDVTFQV